MGGFFGGNPAPAAAAPFKLAYAFFNADGTINASRSNVNLGPATLQSTGQYISIDCTAAGFTSVLGANWQVTVFDGSFSATFAEITSASKTSVSLSIFQSGGISSNATLINKAFFLFGVGT